jgi:serine/threonine protein kinase
MNVHMFLITSCACSLNIMRVEERWKLIDLDAAASFAKPNPGYAGSKSSSAYCAPEMVFQEGGIARIKTYPAEQSEKGKLYDPQPASNKLDMWAFGTVLFLMVPWPGNTPCVCF